MEKQEAVIINCMQKIKLFVYVKMDATSWDKYEGIPGGRKLLWVQERRIYEIPPLLPVALVCFSKIHNTMNYTT